MAYMKSNFVHQAHLWLLDLNILFHLTWKGNWEEQRCSMLSSWDKPTWPWCVVLWNIARCPLNSRESGWKCITGLWQLESALVLHALTLISISTIKWGSCPKWSPEYLEKNAVILHWDLSTIQTPEEDLSDHMQSPGWQPTLCVAWCLIWRFASLEKSMVMRDTDCPYWD